MSLYEIQHEKDGALVRTPAGEFVAWFPTRHGGERTRADARLFVAAAGLLRAAKAVVAKADRRDPAIGRLMAAIGEAEREEQDR